MRPVPISIYGMQFAAEIRQRPSLHAPPGEVCGWVVSRELKT